MNKLNTLFQNKKSNILSVYFTAGYPELDSTATVLKNLEQNNVDLVEIGIPFSDPVADGPVIQESSTIALHNGISLKKLFQQLKPIGKQTKIPRLLMGYLNPVLQFGVEEFCKNCEECEIDGVIIPDLPLLEYKTYYKDIFIKYGLHVVFLISPQTSEERIKEIADESTAFLYAVSTNSTTGGELNMGEREDYYKRIRKITGKPFLIGFGIKDKPTFQQACTYANGAIIGTAFIKALRENNDLKENIKTFIKSLQN